MPKTYNIEDFIGFKYGKLVVLRQNPLMGKLFADCICDCGREKTIRFYKVKSGIVKSCGCILKEIHKANETHGKTKSSEFMTWCNIKRRCYNKNYEQYKIYGGRGIVVCDSWLNSFDNFLFDMGTKPTPSHSLDRIDVNGNYEPSNCRWATAKDQARNRRNNRIITINGESKYFTDWAMQIGISKSSFNRRLKMNYTAEELLSPKRTLRKQFCA